MNINYANVYAVSESDYDLMTSHAEAAAKGDFDYAAEDWEEDAANLYGGEDSYIDSYWESLYE